MKFVGNWLMKNKWALSKLLARTPDRLGRVLTKDEMFHEPSEVVVSRACEALRLEPITFEVPEKIILKHEEDLNPSCALYSYIQKSHGSYQLWSQYPGEPYVPVLRGRVRRKGIVIKVILPRLSSEHNPIRDQLELVQKSLVGQQDQVEDFNYVLPYHIERALFRYRRQYGAKTG